MPVSIYTLLCAGISTLVGLYKSRPTDLGVAHVGIHAVSNSFMQGSSMASIFIVFGYAVFCTTTLSILLKYNEVFSNMHYSSVYTYYSL